jgi:hypothetical protein
MPLQLNLNFRSARRCPVLTPISVGRKRLYARVQSIPDVVSENEMTVERPNFGYLAPLWRCISETPLANSRPETYLFFTVDSFDCIGKNFSAWQACDRLKGTYGVVEEQGRRLRIAAKSIVDSLAFGVQPNSVELAVVLGAV